MKELQVPIRKIHVEVVLDSGDCLRGSLFAPEFNDTCGPFEYVLQILNDERFFLPFNVEGNGASSMVFNKAHIVRVRLDATAPEREALDGVAARDRADAVEFGDDTCTLLLSDGTRLWGRLAVETRWSSSRLLDKLNLAPRFLPIVTDQAVEFIHRDHLVRAT